MSGDARVAAVIAHPTAHGRAHRVSLHQHVRDKKRGLLDGAEGAFDGNTRRDN